MNKSYLAPLPTHELKPDDWRLTLKEVVRRLNVGDKGAHQLWDVLTALRGPDNAVEGWELKRATTAVIREKIGMQMGGPIPVTVRRDTEDSAEMRRRNIVGSNHFLAHVESAFEALELSWDAVNLSEEGENLANNVEVQR